jgi:polyphosphate:AMP phosphotransferase
VLEAVDLKKKVGKEAFRAEFPPLQQRLWELQQAFREARVPAVVLFEGWAGSGKGEAVAKLAERFDPRGIKVHAVFPPGPEDRARPFLWRYWMRLPERGRIAFFHRSWYWHLLDARVADDRSRAECAEAMREIVDFERALVRDGLVLVKLWFHLSPKEQRRRLEELQADEFERWRLGAEAKSQKKRYDDYLAAAEDMLAETDTTEAPWTVVEATDREYRLLKTFKTVVDAMQRALDAREAKPAAATRRARASIVVAALKAQAGLLDRVDLAKRLDDKEYERELPKLQIRLRELQFRCYEAGIPSVVVYEGWDAAGKGGNIRRVTELLDPRAYTVVPIAKPEGDEAAHHYLWRFWRHMPRAGFLTIFDRSWYGRVLVERVEGFATDDEWQRAYQEIREFERSLTAFGTVLVKFWLHISAEEQLRRFKEREETEYKRYKITPEDWRNREKLDVYRPAVLDMLQETSTREAPWTIVEAEDKNWARVRALRTLCGRLEDALAARGEGAGKRRKDKKKKGKKGKKR